MFVLSYIYIIDYIYQYIICAYIIYGFIMEKYLSLCEEALIFAKETLSSPCSYNKSLMVLAKVCTTKSRTKPSQRLLVVVQVIKLSLPCPLPVKVVR